MNRAVTTKPAEDIWPGAMHYKFEPRLNDPEHDTLENYLKRVRHNVLCVTDNSLYLIESPSDRLPFEAIRRVFDPFNDNLVEFERH